MELIHRQRGLLEHLSRDPSGRIVAFRVGPDARTGDHVLTSLYEYAVGGGDGRADPWHILTLELSRGRDPRALCLLAKRLAAEYGAALQELP